MRWQDGVYSVHMSHENYGSAWRHTDLGAAPWNKEMDAQLTDIVKSQGVGQWKRKADELGYGHSDIQVSKRWRHLCDPGVVATRAAASLVSHRSMGGKIILMPPPTPMYIH